MHKDYCLHTEPRKENESLVISSNFVEIFSLFSESNFFGCEYNSPYLQCCSIVNRITT